MSEIKKILPKFDEKGVLLKKQKFCASCKKRMECQKLYEQHKKNKESNELSEVVLSLYYVCDEYENMFIEFPILVNGITSDLSYDRNNVEKNVGRWCVVSVNSVDYDEDLHIGIYMGDLPLSIISLYDKTDTTITNRFYTSPAVYVPKFKKIFYGMNMRWKFIENQDDIDTIAEPEQEEFFTIVQNSIKKE